MKFSILQLFLQGFSVELILEKFDQVGTTDYVDVTTMKVRRNGKSRQLFGKLIYKQPINDSVQVKLSAYMKTGSGWNLLPYKIDKPACAFFSGDQYFYPEIVKKSNLPPKLPCPIPTVSFCWSEKKFITEVFWFQETYEINGWEPSLENVPAMLLKNGDYKVSYSFFLESKEIFQVLGYGSIINIYF